MIDLGFAAAAGCKRLLTEVLAEIIEVLNRYIAAIEYNDKNFADLIGTNIRALCSNLNVAAPMPAKGRDTFVR